jgi:hypothetical protein
LPNIIRNCTKSNRNNPKSSETAKNHQKVAKIIANCHSWGKIPALLLILASTVQRSLKIAKQND